MFPVRHLKTQGLVELAKVSENPCDASVWKKTGDNSYGLDIMSVFLFSQIVPFPPWGPITDSLDGSFAKTAQALGGLFWYLMWPFIFLGFFYHKKCSYRGYLAEIL